MDSYLNVVFFGYSLGDTDRQYFEGYFRNLAMGKMDEHHLVFFYYGDQASNSIKWQLQRFTGNELSNFDMNNMVDYIDCSQEYLGLPKFQSNK